MLSKSSTRSVLPLVVRSSRSRTGSAPRLARLLHAASRSTPKVAITRALRPSTQLAATFSYARTYSTPGSATIFPDPDRPDLFYHLVDPPSALSRSHPVFALSFLSDPLPTSDSCAVIGWLPAAAEAEAQEAGLNDFRENSACLYWRRRCS